ncbi:MAG: hypothetical protein HOP31_12940 [Ignavibacteria bacterium]|nr:hypothetical protein [Ignavibacteria bacterium]
MKNDNRTQELVEKYIHKIEKPNSTKIWYRVHIKIKGHIYSKSYLSLEMARTFKRTILKHVKPT